ncbi:malonate decarboxylase subunit gamma [Alcaligenes faecalis subsp. faecalis NCIB 8687]|nr:malonate decarboxylase subunit gamma [Alcaligenes faecalis subsp. faecalis NCIB 8687]
MKWEALVKSLFDTQHTITEQDLFLQGTAEFEGQTLNVIGTTDFRSRAKVASLLRSSLDTV